MSIKRSLIPLLSLAVATPALAHSGFHDAGGFLSGFSHPFGGLDHVLAMFSVGVFASLLGSWAIWALPASFVVMMLVGGILSMAGVHIPAFELGIAVSIFVLGTAVAMGRSWPLGVALAVVGAFAVLHGYAHGLEMPVGSGPFSYSLGFVLATLLLHVVGLGTGTALCIQGRIVRLSGAAIAIAGMWLALN